MVDLTRRAALAAGLGGGLGAPLVARAAGAWPDRPVRIIAPFGPGGSADTLGRLVARGLTDALGQPFVIENRPGAGGLLGSAQVARAPADGYNLVISGIASHVIAPVTTPGSAEFDGVRDFTEIAYLGGPPIILAVGNAVPAHSVAELLALARAGRPLSYATPGAGTHGALIGELFGTLTGTAMEPIPYRGGAGGMTDLLGGTTEAAFIALTSIAGAVRDDRVRGLAVTAAARLPAFPAVPTFAELGYPSLTAVTWFGLAGPARLPAPITERLNAETRRVMATGAVRARLDEDGIVSPAMTAPEFARFVAEEAARWTPIARASAAAAAR